MVRTAGKGSEAINARQGSTSRGGGCGGRGGQGSRNPNPRLDVTGPSRPSNLNPGRPIGGFLNSRIGHPASRTPKDTSASMIPPGSDKRGISFILAAIDQIDPDNAIASAASGSCGEGEAEKMTADVATTSAAHSGGEPEKMVDDDDGGRPFEEVEEGEILEPAVVQVGEEKEFVVPDLNLQPPPDE